MVNSVALHTVMQDFGQVVDEIYVKLSEPVEDLQPGDFLCKNCCKAPSGKYESAGVVNLTLQGCTLTLKCDPFLFRCDFSVENAALGLKITKDSVNAVLLHHEELFRPVIEDGVRYQLHEPATRQPRPLILFLHGGGASGEDNRMQLTDTLGPIKLAERVPDMYVMAPQAPSGGSTMEELLAKMNSKGGFRVKVGEDTDNAIHCRGWNRDYLGRVSGIIRRMIAEGKVDPARVYVTGLSMGGGGTLKTLATDADLFAAAVAVCPTMNGETYTILENLPEVPTYIASAYIDHQRDRHAYLLRGVQKLWEEGRRDVKLTLFTQEELAAYGIGTDPSLTQQELYAENHNSWVLVYHNEFGILDWMLKHKKK